MWIYVVCVDMKKGRGDTGEREKSRDERVDMSKEWEKSGMGEEWEKSRCVDMNKEWGKSGSERGGGHSGPEGENCGIRWVLMCRDGRRKEGTLSIKELAEFSSCNDQIVEIK